MSADNYIAVYPDKGKTQWFICHGFASNELEDCLYRGSTLAVEETRAEALIKAHDLAKEEAVLEYGVIELTPIPETPCERCWVCVYERNKMAEDLSVCDKCNKVITDSEIQTLVNNGVYHTRCEPR